MKYTINSNPIVNIDNGSKTIIGIDDIAKLSFINQLVKLGVVSFESEKNPSNNMHYNMSIDVHVIGDLGKQHLDKKINELNELS